MTTVSNPVKVEVEIEDLTTGCTYVYRGARIKDCVDYFLSLFFGGRQHRIVYARNCEEVSK